MKLLDILVLCIAFLLIPVIKASNKYTKDSGSQRTIMGISAVCYDPEDVCKVVKPCKNGATCSPVLHDKNQPYKCKCVLGYGGVNCEEKLISLKVEKTTPREAVLSAKKSKNFHWAAYIIELVNRRTTEMLKSKHFVESEADVTKITLPSLDPGTSYSVRVGLVQNNGEPEKWIDEASFETPVYPSFTKAPKNVTYLVIGENITIECDASGAPKPTVKWTGSLLPLPEGRSHQQDGRLSINKAEIKDSGSYTCTATSKLGVVSTTTELVVRPPGNCDFDRNLCGFNQDSDDIFNWTRQSGPTPDRDINYATGPRGDHTGGGSYMYIEASNPRVKGDNAKLSIMITLSGRSCLSFYYHMFGWSMGPLNVTIDGNSVFSKSGNQENRWTSSQAYLSGTGNKKLVFEGIIGTSWFGDAAIDDVKFFDCQVSPSFNKIPKKSVFSKIDKPLTIECDASGVPKPTIKWTGLTVLQQKRSYQQDGRLTIYRVQTQDSGNYTCTVSNKQGVINATTELVVREYHFSRSDSVILSGHPDYEQKLNEYLEPVKVSGKQWKLCYRASEHNYSARAFHTSCDRKGATVTLVRVGIYVFGGYADESWDAPSRDGISGHFRSDKAFLFSLKNHLNEQYKMFTYRNQGFALNNKNSWGPHFGNAGDLFIDDRCDVNTDSHSNLGSTYKPPNGYTAGSPEATKLLAGSYEFKCDEYEVFYQK